MEGLKFNVYVMHNKVFITSLNNSYEYETDNTLKDITECIYEFLKEME